VQQSDSAFTLAGVLLLQQQQQLLLLLLLLLLPQGLTHARITFKNEASGEYTYYEVKLTSTAPAPMGRLSLECPVRNQTSATVSITNPLDVPVTLKPTITSKQVWAEHSRLTNTHRPSSWGMDLPEQHLWLAAQSGKLGIRAQPHSRTLAVCCRFASASLI
jgi:hypothetical protein